MERPENLLAQRELENREVIERANITGVRPFKCNNHVVHNIRVINYDDGSTWVACPLFGWYSDVHCGESSLKLGCKERKKRCTWFIRTR